MLINDIVQNEYVKTSSLFELKFSARSSVIRQTILVFNQVLHNFEAIVTVGLPLDGMLAVRFGPLAGLIVKKFAFCVCKECERNFLGLTTEKENCYDGALTSCKYFGFGAFISSNAHCYAKKWFAASFELGVAVCLSTVDSTLEIFKNYNINSIVYFSINFLNTHFINLGLDFCFFLPLSSQICGLHVGANLRIFDSNYRQI